MIHNHKINGQKLVTSDVSKVDKFNDINDLQPQKILLILFNKLEVFNPAKSNDFNEEQSLNIEFKVWQFVALKVVKLISIIVLQF